MVQTSVSVALATYNGERYIREQLESYLRQQRLPDELVISDDGSTDDTLAIIDTWKATVPFKVRVLKNSGEHGHIGNFHNAISNCAGECILTSDQDDVWLDEHISELVACFETDSDLLALVSESNCVDENLDPLGYTLSVAMRATSVVRQYGTFPAYAPFDQVLRLLFAFGHGMAFRRSLLGSAQPISKNWGHDSWLFLIAALMGRAAYLAKPLTLYRQHSSQTCGGRRDSLVGLALSAAGNQDPSPPADNNEGAKGTQSPIKLHDLLIAARKYHDSCDNMNKSVSEANVNLIVKKYDFLVWRSKIKTRSLAARIGSVLWQLVLGRYHLYGRGFLACARDIVG